MLIKEILRRCNVQSPEGAPLDLFVWPRRQSVHWINIQKGGGMFEAFNPHTRCSDCTAISTIYGSILWPVDTCFYRCCMFVVLLRLDPIRIFLMWICHMLQTGCSWILCVLDFLSFFQIRLGHFGGKDWTYRFNERKEIFIN